MKIALIGYGKMGKMVEQIALQEGHVVVCTITSTAQEWQKLQLADVAIDFSTPEAVVENVKQCARHHTNLVIGTTGWLSSLEDVQKIGKEAHIGILYAPNFSLGVHLFLQLLQASGHLFNPFPDYQAAGIEIHHNQKKDAPSGTALAMRDFLKKGMLRQEEIPLTSVRLGTITGKHTLLFDSPFDTISISHEAKNTEGFAIGSIRAAEWLMKKEGFYTVADMFNLKTAVRDGKVMQDFDSESVPLEGDHSQKVKDPSNGTDSGSKGCVNLPSPTAVFRFK